MSGAGFVFGGESKASLAAIQRVSTSGSGDMKPRVAAEHHAALLAWRGAAQSAQAMLLEGMKALGDRPGSERSARLTLVALRRLEVQIASGLAATVPGKAQASPAAGSGPPLE